jgi:hypothetical protein
MLANRPCSLESPHAWHVDIHQDHIRQELFRLLQGFLSIAGLAYNLKVWFKLQYTP